MGLYKSYPFKLFAVALLRHLGLYFFTFKYMFMAALVFLALLGVLGYLVYKIYCSRINSVSSAQHYTFEFMKFSTQEFYVLTEGLVKEKAIPGVRLSRVYHSTKGIFSAKREYLRVVYQNYFFDICAAPFAKDFFVSWRQGTLNEFINIGKRRYKTFYEQDTECMFMLSVKLCVNRAMKLITEDQGVRHPDAQLATNVKVIEEKRKNIAEMNDWPRINEEYAGDF